LGIFERTIWYLDIVGAAALLVFLWRNGLYRTYRGLFLYLSIDLLNSLVAAPLRLDSNAFAVTYLFFRTLKVFVAVFVVSELYRLVLADHPALAAFGQKVVAGILALAGLIAASGLAMDYSAAPRYPILKGFRVFERTMDAWMAIFLLLIACFVVWFPVRMKRNVALYIGGFAAWSLARSSMLLFINLMPPRLVYSLGTAILTVELLCLLVWLLGLRPEGERVTTVTRRRWSPEALEHLTGQLGSINANLSRLRR
jgi:hypothetical protein